MKKTFTINISGSVFHVEEDAFDKLQEYLQSLNYYFSNQAGGQEIIQDIESRIAELFREKINEKQEVVTIEWVEEVMAKMGKLEDFTGSEEELQSEGKGEKIRKRMYRDTEHRVLGGVCSGMSAYFNIDPVFLRIIFVSLVFLGAGISIVVYLIFWIVVPKATTTAQRLEMRGEEPTITNIQKTIQEEVKEVKNSFSKINQSDSFKRGKNAVNKVGQASTKLFKGLGRLFVVLFGAFFIFLGFISLVLFFISLTLGSSVFQGNGEPFHSNVDLSSLLGFYISPGLVSVSILLIVLLIGIPLLAVFFIGTKMVFRYKTNNKAIGLGALGVWLVALISGIAMVAGQANNFATENTATTGQLINCQTCQTLYLELGNSPLGISDDNMHVNNFIVASINGQQVIAGRPHLNIESHDGNDFLVTIKRKARGRNRSEIQNNLMHIQYEVISKDSTLLLNPYFTLDNQVKWRDQEVQVTVKVPKGKKVHLGENLDQLQFDFENLDNPLQNQISEDNKDTVSKGMAMNN